MEPLAPRHECRACRCTKVPGTPGGDAAESVRFCPHACLVAVLRGERDGREPHRHVSLSCWIVERPGPQSTFRTAPRHSARRPEARGASTQASGRERGRWQTYIPASSSLEENVTMASRWC